MAFPKKYLLDPGFHSQPIEQREQTLSQEDPEFAAFPQEKKRKILDSAASKYGRKPETPLESAGKDISIGFRGGVSDLARTGANITGGIGLTGASEAARKFSKDVAPKPEETAGRTSVFNQVMQGVGAAPASLVKYAPAALAPGKVAPALIAGAIGAVSKADEGWKPAVKEGVKDIATFGLMGQAGKLESRAARAGASAAASAGTTAAFEGGDTKQIVSSAIMGGGFGAAGKGEKKETLFKVTPEQARTAFEKGGIAAFDNLVDPVRKAVAPQNRGPEARRMANIIRANVSEVYRQADIADYALEQASKHFRMMKDPERLEVIGAIESGAKQKTPQLQKFADTMRSIHNEVRDELIHEASRVDPKTGELKPTALKGVADAIRNPDAALRSYYLNYFPHLFKDPEKARGIMQGYYAGKRPLRGPATFLKERSHPTIADALSVMDETTGKPALELLTTDPVESYMLKWREMKRFTASQKIIKEMQGEGLLEYVPLGKRGPKDWVEVRDPAFRRSVRLKDGSMKISGSFWAPEQAGRVLNNYLSPGLRGREGAMGTTYRGLMGFNNVLNQAQLGFSAFHLGFTSVDAVTSRFALGLEQAVEGARRGDVKMAAKGAGNILKATPIGAPITLVENIRMGRKMRQEWRKPGSSGDPKTAELVAMMQEAGAGVSLDPVYRTDMTHKVYEVFRNQQGYLSLAYKAPGMLNEKLAGLIMDKFVPWQKLGIFADLARFELERLPQGAPRNQVREVMGKAWDSVDNRMGMLRYDNLFWEKWIKDMAMVSMRSVGWNIGTLRELGGGGMDLAKAIANKGMGKHSEFTHRAAYTLALPAVAGMMGGMIHFMYNGKPPEDLKDWYFPRTGRKDEFGKDERLSIPSYVKDVYHMATQPGKTIANKLHPSISLISDMLSNQDFYHTEIANKDDPFMKKVASEAEFVLKQFSPFSWTNISKEIKEGAPPSEIGATFFGFVPAPSDIKKTPAEKAATEIMAENLPKRPSTREERERQMKRRELERKIRVNDNWQQFAQDALADGSLSELDVEHSIDRGGSLPLDRSFSRMRLQDAMRVYKLANPEEQQRLRPILDQKVERNVDKIDALPEKQKQKMVKELLEILGQEPGSLPPGA